MRSFSPNVIPDLRDGYVELLRSVLRYGRRREARGFASRDVRDFSFTVTDPSRVIPYGVGRDKLNDDVAYAEATLLCGGIASPGLLASVTGGFRRFMDGGQLAGAYGPLVRPQMESVVSTLRDDPDSRQAVVRVHPGAHEVAGLRDVPCTLFLGLELDGEGRLHLRATMRSNDAWLGLPYDAFMFCQLGWTVANVLGVELASYSHHSYSFHVYDRDVDKVDALHQYEGAGHAEPRGFGLFGPGPYEDARRRAEAVHDRTFADLDPPRTASEDMYVSHLAGYDRLTRTAGFKS